MVTEDIYSQLSSVSIGIFETMSGICLVPSEIKLFDQTEGSGYTGRIEISGEWNGAVTVHYSPEMASQVASAMLADATQVVSLDEKRDVLKEILNMIGGNMKSMLPGPSRLSIPFLEENVGGKWPVHLSKSANWLGFESEGKAVWVSLSEEVPS